MRRQLFAALTRVHQLNLHNFSGRRLSSWTWWNGHTHRNSHASGRLVKDEDESSSEENYSKRPPKNAFFGFLFEGLGAMRVMLTINVTGASWILYQRARDEDFSPPALAIQGGGGETKQQKREERIQRSEERESEREERAIQKEQRDIAREEREVKKSMREKKREERELNAEWRQKKQHEKEVREEKLAIQQEQDKGQREAKQVAPAVKEIGVEKKLRNNRGEILSLCSMSNEM